MERETAQVVEALNRAHHALHETLTRLQSDIQPGKALPADLNTRLKNLQHTLLEHFRFEEHGGYMSSVIEGRPHLAHTADRLLADHTALAVELEKLIGDCNSGCGADLESDFAKRLQAWITHLLAHEQDENVLVEDAYNRDIGNKD